MHHNVGSAQRNHRSWTTTATLSHSSSLFGVTNLQLVMTLWVWGTLFVGAAAVQPNIEADVDAIAGGQTVDNATRAGAVAAALHRANGSATLPPALQGEAQKNSEPYGSLLNRNLVYIKLPKCASSTTGGVARRIAAHQGLSGTRGRAWIKKEPGVRSSSKLFCLHAVTAL